MGVRHTIHDLADDLRGAALEVAAGSPRIVAANVRSGQRRTKAFAKESAGEHGKHYPDAISMEMTSPTSGEWFTDGSKPQGDMSFEGGSRNQPAHLDFAKASDLVTPQFHDDVDDLLDRALW